MQFCVWVAVVKARLYLCVLGSTDAPIACVLVSPLLPISSLPVCRSLFPHFHVASGSWFCHRRPSLCLLWGLETQQAHSSGLRPSQFSTFLPSSGASFSSPFPTPRFSLLTKLGSHIASCLLPCSGSQLRPVGDLKKTLCVLVSLALHLRPHKAARGTWIYFFITCVCARVRTRAHMGCIRRPEDSLCRQSPPSAM